MQLQIEWISSGAERGNISLGVAELRIYALLTRFLE